MRPTRRPLTVLALALGLTLPTAEARTTPPAAACVDFEAHVNTAWRQAHPLPADAASISRLGQFQAMAEQQAQRLLTDVVAAPRDDKERLLAAFWAAGSDPAVLDTRSAAALTQSLAPLQGLRRARDLPVVSARLHALGLAPLIEFTRLDAGNGALAAAPAPLGLGDPAFYLRPEAEFQTLLGQYRAYLETLLRASGLPAVEAGAAAEAVVQIETQLAQSLASPSTEPLQPARLRELDRRYAGLGFATLLDQLDADARELAVLNPAYFTALSQRIANETPQRLQSLLRARVLLRLAPALGAPFRDAHAEFEGRVLRGLAEPPTTSAVLAESLRRQLPGLLDSVANARRVDAPLRERSESVVRAVQAAAAARDPRFGEVRIDLAGSATPAVDFSGLRFSADDPVGNRLRLARWHEQRVLAGLAAPVSPFPALRPALQFDPATQRLSISAAALAPPLLGDSPAADFGAFGALLGHELSKALDAGDRGARLLALYNGFEVVPGLRVDGRRTLPMNRADLAGLEFAWAAFIASHPSASNAEKRAFFAAWAGLWAKHASPAALREDAARSPAAPARWRVNGPLSQLPAFAETFGCRAGQAMHASSPISVWF